MKEWCKENGGHYRSGTVEDSTLGTRKVGYIFNFFDEETAMAFCLSFDINPNGIKKGIKR